MLRAMTTSTSKRRQFSLQVKVDIIKFVEKHPDVSYCDVGKKFEASKDVVYRAVKDKENIMQAFEKRASSLESVSSSKRLKTSDHPQLEEALITWIRSVRSQNIPLDGPTVLIKAEAYSTALGIENFKASQGWLSNFKKRHGITFQRIQGEAASVREHDTEEWKRVQLPKLLEKYTMDCIYNADETGLFWEALPNLALGFRGETCEGGKKSKKRVTVLLCANADGSDKLTPLVIGKSRRPRCFNNISTLPLQYEANAKSWMTASLFEKWLKAWDKRLGTCNRQVVLVLDNCPSHPKDIVLKNIELLFLPPQTTARTQPMDQGIIQNAKVHYRRLLLRRRIAAIDDGNEFHFSLLDSVHCLSQAWKSVTPITVANCFKKAGFIATIINDAKENDCVESMDTLNDYWSRLEELHLISDSQDMEEYLSIDSAVITSAQLSDEDILAGVQETKAVENEEDSTCDMIETETKAIPKGKEARAAIDVLRRYISGSETGASFLESLDAIEDFIYENESRQRQSKITRYLSFTTDS